MSSGGLERDELESRTVTHDPVTVRKVPEYRTDGVVVKYSLESSVGVPVEVEFVDGLPRSRSQVGFHPEHAPASWTAEDDSISIVQTLDPGETHALALGLVLDGDDVDAFDPSCRPEVTNVESLTTESERAAAEKRGGGGGNGLFERARETLFSESGDRSPDPTDREPSETGKTNGYGDGTLDLADPTADGDGDDERLDLADPDEEDDDGDDERLDLADPDEENEDDDERPDLSDPDEDAESDVVSDVEETEETEGSVGGDVAGDGTAAIDETEPERTDPKPSSSGTGTGSEPDESARRQSGSSTFETETSDSGASSPGSDSADSGASSSGTEIGSGTSRTREAKHGSGRTTERNENLVSVLVSELRDASDEEIASLREALDDDPSRSEQIRLRHVQSRMDDFSVYSEVLEEFIDEYGTPAEHATETEAALSDIEADVSELQTEQSALRSAVDELESSLEALRNDVEGIESELESVREDHGSELDDLTARQEDLSTRFETLTAQQEATESTLRDLETTTGSRIETLSEVVDEFEAVHHELADVFDRDRFVETGQIAEGRES